MSTPKIHWQTLPALGLFDSSASATLRKVLADGAESLEQRFLDGEAVNQLVQARAQLVDHVLIHAWQGIMTDATDDLAFVAVGGYGRGELHPASDIDVMLLLPKGNQDQWRNRLEKFVTFLWDIGLEVGHSVRSVKDCVNEAKQDVTVATNMMETRLLAGDDALFDKMRHATSAKKIWPPKKFFEAKAQEQKSRHARYSDTSQNLEPSVKGSPGGLRDLQMIGWVLAREFGESNLEQLLDVGFLTPGELEDVLQGRDFLWRIRFALHLITQRREDRLLFDHQVTISKMLKYADREGSLGVEQFMQDYYRTAKKVLRLNEILLQLYQERLNNKKKTRSIQVDSAFFINNGYLTAEPGAFAQDPSAILRLFILIQKYDAELKGVSATTLRELHDNLDLIDQEFRHHRKNQQLFLAILRAPAGVTHELRRMNRYGVLGRYIPAFNKIVGRMQYDLFHAYTVDAHTLFVVGNLRRFALTRFDHEFPRCSEIMQSLPKPELAYLSGIFHDIAKGRGGDHSILGIQDAHDFCDLHQMSDYDRDLVGWLVEHHLLLSITAQKKDISDPDTIQEFAKIVGDEVRLDYLYVLTVADVRGTNPKLWNAWKANLFEELYLQTKKVLERGLENPFNREELTKDTRRAALGRLEHHSYETVSQLWSDFSEEYFLRHSAEEIAWHTDILLRRKSRKIKTTDTLVGVQETPSRGGNAIFLYTPSSRNLFARITQVLVQLNLTIVEAQINTTKSGAGIDTFIVLEANQKPINDPRRFAEIRKKLAETANETAPHSTINQRVSRQLKAFDTPVNINCSDHESGDLTIVDLTAPDRPGLLGVVGSVFLELGIDIHKAKITTVGERAEDVFFVTDHDGNQLSEETIERLRQQLGDKLRSPSK